MKKILIIHSVAYFKPTETRINYFSNVCRPCIDSNNFVCGFMQMVIYEAARALVNLKNLKSRDLCPAISGSIIEEPTYVIFNFSQIFNVHTLKKGPILYLMLMLKFQLDLTY